MLRGLVVGPLENRQAIEALVRPPVGTGVRADDDLVAEVVAAVDGYPYFLQLWGLSSGRRRCRGEAAC